MSDTQTLWPEPLRIIKISGKIIDDPKSLEKFLQAFLRIESKKILVHGGGVEIDNLMKSHDIPITKIDGKRITNLSALGATLIQCSTLNARIVERLNAMAAGPASFAGLPEPGTYIYSTKRKIIRNPDGTRTNYKYVGDVSWDMVDTLALQLLLQNGRTPVLSPITFDEDRKLFLNSNADGVATVVAIAMSVQSAYNVSLEFRSDVAGVLRDAKDPHSVIKHIGSKYYDKLKADGIISDGMIPKLESAFRAINNGVSRVMIGRTVITK
jgi:acetylglutamate kinase